jgi:hypothetical protein
VIFKPDYKISTNDQLFASFPIIVLKINLNSKGTRTTRIVRVNKKKKRKKKRKKENMGQSGENDETYA